MLRTSVYDFGSCETEGDTPLAPARQGRLGTQGELPRRGKRRCPGVRVPRQRNKSQVHALTFIGNFTRPAAAGLSCLSRLRRNTAGKRKARQRRAFLRASRAISVQSCRRQGGRTGAPQCAALNSPRKSGRVPDFLTSARAAAARPRPLCGREGVIAPGFAGTGGVSKGDSVPLRMMPFYGIIILPSNSARRLISAMTVSNWSRSSDCAPSHSACFGSLCASMIRPSAPAAIAARESG